MLDFTDIRVLSFDCYGTLIDWESGILSALRPLISRYGVDSPDRELLELYGRFERQAQEQTPFVNYKTVLREVAASFYRYINADPNTDPQADAEHFLVDSLGDWPAFPDTAQALESLNYRFKLAIISNVDDDLFRLSQNRLGVPFDWVITSEQIGSYKPSEENFRHARRIMGVEPVQEVPLSATTTGSEKLYVTVNSAVFFLPSPVVSTDMVETRASTTKRKVCESNGPSTLSLSAFNNPSVLTRFPTSWPL